MRSPRLDQTTQEVAIAYTANELILRAEILEGCEVNNIK